MQIVNLRQRPDAIAQLAKWHYGEWAQLYPQQSLADFQRELRDCLRPELLPSTWLALDAERVLGSASLVASDMDNWPELGPWLASVYLCQDQRGRGLGSQLVQHVMREASQAGLATLYLFTTDRENFYHRLGWQRWRVNRYHGRQVTIMQYDCDPGGDSPFELCN